MAKPADNITQKVLIQESINKIKDLATELCLPLGLPNLMVKEVTKNEIKHAIRIKIKEECI